MQVTELCQLATWNVMQLTPHPELAQCSVYGLRRSLISVRKILGYNPMLPILRVSQYVQVNSGAVPYSTPVACFRICFTDPFKHFFGKSMDLGVFEKSVRRVYGHKRKW
jgi:hypothetical protein